MNAVLRNVCKEPPEFLVHNISRPPQSSISQGSLSDYIARIEAENGDVEFGGRWSPHDCIPVRNVVIIVPFLGDNFQLWTWLRYMHPVLKRQKLHYQIFVVENQSDTTGGAVLSVGQFLNSAAEQARYKGMQDGNVCLVFHYPSILPATDDEYFDCTEGTVKTFVDDPAGFIISMFADDFDYVDGFSQVANEPTELAEDLRTRSALYMHIERLLLGYHSVNQQYRDGNKVSSLAHQVPTNGNLQFERSRRLFTHLSVKNSL
uniref:Galactosyltransferase N-terminal domain-containing protein n=1 Tax=Plectus sambesii TaxID=2011161 RepID=A0A914WQ21_9BILA